MATLVKHEFNIIASSNPANGAANVSPDGDRFQVILQDPVEIPRNALNIELSLEESNIVWTIPNIVTGVNDTLYIDGPDTLDVLQNYVITIPQGLYDLSGLQQAILRELENAGAKTNPDPLILLSGDSSTQKAEIRFNYTTVSIDFTQTDTFREILGFNSQVLGPYVSVTTVLADNVAAFNQVTSFLIHSDLTSTGLRVNNNYYQVLGQVQIDVLPGSLITSTPFNPARTQAPELAGAKRGVINMWLTDQDNRGVNTASEFWNTRIRISYMTPMVLEEEKS